MILSMQDKIQELLDKQAIAELTYLYASAIDRGDFELLATLFTSDAMLHYGVYEAPASALIASGRGGRSAPYLMTHHQMGNLLVQFDGDDRATAVSYLHAVHRAQRDGGAIDEMVRARYFDRLVKRDGKWRFAERTLVFDWSHIAAADSANWWDGGGDKVNVGARFPDDLTTQFLRGYLD